MPVGVCIHVSGASDFAADFVLMRDEWCRLGIDEHIERHEHSQPAPPRLQLQLGVADRARMPDFNTLNLASSLKLDEKCDDDLLREIWLTLLHSPVLLEFPNAAELLSAVRIRRNIVRNAARTCMNFAPLAIERPADCWSHSEETGFVLLPGKPLIESLRKACQPAVGGQLYSFSCYRATEYVLLLSMAEEVEQCHPELLRHMQSLWERRALVADQFHHVFLSDIGSQQQPLPVDWFVPGDRVWFRNPDAHSSDVYGYEGSWVFYLGGGRFSNFWKSDRPFDLLTKCVEIFHWRDATWRDADGVLQMDETKVESLVARTLADPHSSAAIFRSMHCLSDAPGVYADGGCMDPTREVPKHVMGPHGAIVRLLQSLA